MAKRARRKTPGYRHKQACGSEITAYLLNPSDRSCLPAKVLIDPDVDCYAKIDYHTAADVINDLQGEIIIVDGQSMMILDMMINGKQQRNLHMTVASLDRYEMILGRRWLEESHARLNDGDLIWLDCEKKKLTNQPLVEERSEDGCLHVELEELRKDSLAMTDDERAQQLRELEVSEIEFLEHSDPLSSYEDTFGEIRDESQRIDDMIWQLCELEDSDQGITVTAFPSPETEENLPACQDIYESHEDLEVNESRIFELSDEVYNKSFSSCAGEDEEDCPDSQDFYRSRVPITNDHQCLPPVVRLPMNDFRISRLSDDDLAVTTPAPVTTTSKNQIVVDEDMIAVGPMVVRLPGRQDLELSLSPPPSPSDVQKAKEDTEETCLAETAWNEELDDCRNESHDSQISVDSGIDHEDRNRDVCNDISDSKQNGPKDVTQEESQSLDLNILGDAPDDKANDFGHRSQLDVQTGIVDGPYSFNLLECAYDPGVCLPFGSTPEKDIRIHLMDGIGCQLVDPAYQLVISPTCPGGMKIIFFNDISPDTGWCRFPIDSSYTFSEGAWNFGNYDNASDCEGDKLDTQIEVASQFMWMPGCDTLSNLVSLVFFWFDTGWYLTIDGMF